MSVGWPVRACLGIRGFLVGLLLVLVGAVVGSAWLAEGDGGERGSEAGAGFGVERVVVREPAAALRMLGLPRSVGADDGGRAGPLAVLWLVPAALGSAWGGRRVAPVGGWRVARRPWAALGSRAPPRVRHA
jgi:hypothetical protein